jgi:hypothetical protein
MLTLVPISGHRQPVRQPRKWWLSGLLRGLMAIMLASSVSGTARAATELVENAVHLLRAGHSARAAEHPEGGDTTEDREHDCTGATHTCSCCPTQPGLMAPVRQAGPVAAKACMQLPSHDGRASEGVPRRIDRPPRG